MALPFKKEEKKEEKKVDAAREKELALRAAFKDVKSVTPQGKIEKGSVTPTGHRIG